MTEQPNDKSISDDNRPYLSIVLPCFNAEKRIARSVEIIETFLNDHRDTIPSWEIIAVDDGSRDGTAEVLQGLKDRVHAIVLGANEGKGAAVRRGILASRGAYCVFMDDDVPYDLEILPEMLQYLDFKEFHVCIGARPVVQPEGAPKRSPLRRLSSYIFTLFISRLVVTGIRDTQCGLKGFRGDVAKYLFAQSKIQGFAFDVEILYLAFKNDFDIKRVPVTLVSDDESSVSVLRHGIPMLVSVFGIPYRWHTKQYDLFSDNRED